MSKNKRKDAFIAKVSVAKIEGGIADSNIHKLMNFNLNFFNRDQPHTSDFDKLEGGELLKLVNKLVNFSDKSLIGWSYETAGGHNLFVNYRTFPSPSGFRHPACVPHDVEWCRFRIGSKLRLIGFVIPNSFHGVMKDGFCYDKNTFYVVFIDKEHKFYMTEER
ncbi:hypothetical protein [Pseudomonas syringae]|uniref:hypothetical protein n=1 Tax=Pseudomonas syringae TaxID=317 RepID=UPI00073FA421|nr:hypothetical protein [Pseudomonas syringae]